MFLRTGGDVAIVSSDIVGIFDIDENVTPEITRNFLRNSEKNVEVISDTNNIPKSFVLTSDGNHVSRVVLSAVSAKRLKMRAEDSDKIISKLNKTVKIG